MRQFFLLSFSSALPHPHRQLHRGRKATEAGVPGYDLTPWYGVFAPANTPRPIVIKLNQEIGRIINGPEMKPRFAAQGVDLVTSTPEEFAALIRTEIPKWRELVKKSGASVG